MGGKEFKTTIDEATKISNYIKKKVTNEVVLGPSVASLSRINNVYYFEVIIKYRNKEKIVELLNDIKVLNESNNKIKIEFDINPNSF